MKIYLSGPMTGLPDLNFPAFNEAAERIRELGHEVSNPADLGSGKSWEWYMRQHFRSVTECEAIALLPGWEASSGARTELFLAYKLKMPVLDAETLEPLPLEHVYSFDWLMAERAYQLGKFGIEADDEHTKAGPEWWQQQFDNYLGRVFVYGLEEPNGRQALAKFVATACGWLESAVRLYGPLPAAGVSSGNNLDALVPLP